MLVITDFYAKGRMMDALKWIFKTSIVVAMVFFGLKADPQKKDQPEPNKSAMTLIQLIN
jgi:hypothetical protein